MQTKATLFGIYFLIVIASTVRAESLPHWKPDNLVPRSGLILLASQEKPNKLTIEMILKGAWPEREIEVPGLGLHRQMFGRLGGMRAPDLTGQVVVFLSLRHGRPTVVANGVYRVTNEGTVLGYAQEINPGPYELQPEPVYESLDALIDEMETAKTNALDRQSSLMKQLANAKDDRTFRGLLDALDQITCVGDKKVFNFIAGKMASMASGDNRSRRCLYFLQNFPDPAIFPLLKDYYTKTGKVDVLNVIGQQGSPEALPFLRQVAVEGANNESSRFASFGLMTLYMSLERRGMNVECEKVRETVFDLFDKEPFFREYAKSSPRVLGVIPHAGSVSRLETTLKKVKGDRSNREYEVALVLDHCRRKIANRANSR